MVEEPPPPKMAACAAHSVWGDTEERWRQPSPRPHRSGGSRSISKGGWHTVVAGSTGVSTAASEPLVSVLLSYPNGGEGEKWTLEHRCAIVWPQPALASYCQRVLQNSLWNSLWLRNAASWVATVATRKPVGSNPLKTRGEPLPALPLCTLPARTKSKKPEPRELCLGDPTF